MVKHNFEKRKKEACLKSLLKPTSTSFFRVRPTDEEVKSKIVRERIQNMHTTKPDSLQSLRYFREQVVPQAQ